MTRGSIKTRIERLEALKSLLRLEDYCTVGDLAERLSVSTRTVARDLDVLRSQGLPIDADRGRGGGIRLDRNWGIGRVNLSHPEAVDLLVSLAVAEQMDSPLFLANLSSIRRQLMASFSPDKRHQVNDLKARILIGQSASKFVLSSFQTVKREVVQRLHQAFLTKRSLTIRYAAESGDETSREIEPHYLLLNYPVWYVLAWDKLRGAPRTFRCDRISGAHGSEERFTLISKETFNSSIEGSHLL